MRYHIQSGAAFITTPALWNRNHVLEPQSCPGTAIMSKKSPYTDQTQPPHFRLDTQHHKHEKAALRSF